MSDTEKKLIELDDWVYRFFGFLGAFDYRRMKYPQEAPREGLDAKKKVIPSDNILYIYGVPQGGKTAYKRFLVERLREQPRYIPLRVDFKGLPQGQTMEIQQKLREYFLRNDNTMRFPFLGLLDDYGKHDLLELDSLFNGYLSNVGDILNGGLGGNALSVVKVATGLVQSAAETVRFLNRDDRHCQAYRAEIEKLKQKKKEDPGGELFDEEDVFHLLRYDLCLNTRLRKEKRYICFVDNYELSRLRLTKQERKKFLLMMNEVSDMIWVLFSGENPGTEEMNAIPRENRWRMNGLNESQAISYLRAALPDEGETWYTQVYQHTGGNPGLMNLCIQEQKNEERKLVISEKRTGAAESLDTDKQCEDQVDQWFQRVWDGRAGREGLGDSPIAFLMEAMLEYAENGSGNQVKQNLIPGLCYLAEKSKAELGTVRQFCWERGANIAELKNEGRECLKKIEACTPLCVEYVEFPDILYLDPIIVRILTQHAGYQEWLAYFRNEYISDHVAGHSDQEIIPATERFEEKRAETGNQMDYSESDYSAYKEFLDWQEFNRLKQLYNADLRRVETLETDKMAVKYPQGAEVPPAEAQSNRDALPHSLRGGHVAKTNVLVEDEMNVRAYGAEHLGEKTNEPKYNNPPQ